MSTTDVEAVRSFVLRYVAEGLAGHGLEAADVPASFDLLAEEVIDSFGLLDLIADVERKFEVRLDFSDVDADELTMIGPFSEFVAERMTSASGAPVAESAKRTPPAALPQVTPPSAKRPSAVERLFGRSSMLAYRGSVRARDKLFSLAVSGDFRRFGARTVIQMPSRIVGARGISIGSDSFIGLGSWLQVLGDVDREAIVIGDGAGFAGFIVISAVESIRIGRNVSCARNVYIADHAHEYDAAGSVIEEGLNDIRPIVIGDGVWLGENAVILPGVKIGEGAVVGANSVVTSDVPARSLALGSPARVIRSFGGRAG